MDASTKSRIAKHVCDYAKSWSIAEEQPVPRYRGNSREEAAHHAISIRDCLRTARHEIAKRATRYEAAILFDPLVPSVLKQMPDLGPSPESPEKAIEFFYWVLESYDVPESPRLKLSKINLMIDIASDLERFQEEACVADAVEETEIINAENAEFRLLCGVEPASNSISHTELPKSTRLFATVVRVLTSLIY